MKPMIAIVFSLFLGAASASAACTTFSSGFVFESATRSGAIARCQADKNTNNGECERNVECVAACGCAACSTFSSGLVFESATRSGAIARCQADKNTNNGECERNVECAR